MFKSELSIQFTVEYSILNLLTIEELIMSLWDRPGFKDYDLTDDDILQRQQDREDLYQRQHEEDAYRNSQFFDEDDEFDDFGNRILDDECPF